MGVPFVRSAHALVPGAFLVGLTCLASCSGNSSAPGAPAVQAPPAVGEPPAEDAGPPDGGSVPDAALSPTSRGCGVAPAGGGTLTRKSTKASAKVRTYHLGVPAQLALHQAVPLVFVLHGATDTAPEKMRDWFAVEGQMPPALFVYPQALPRTRHDGSGGLVTRWDLRGDDDTTFFDVMLDEIAGSYCVDRAHVFVTGFSSGGNFAQQLACLRPKDVAGMAVVAGPGPFSDMCGGAVSAWMTHDTNDASLPVADARASRDFWASQNACGKTTWGAVAGRPECQRNSSCTAGSALVYCETSGVGHKVPDYAPGAIADFFSGLLK